MAVLNAAEKNLDWVRLASPLRSVFVDKLCAVVTIDIPLMYSQKTLALGPIGQLRSRVQA